MMRANKRSVTSLRRCGRVGSAQRRGFTLVELLITCAMIGVLSALGLVGYRRFITSSQSTEATGVIAMIRGGEEAYKAEMLVYLGPSVSTADFYPRATPDNSRMLWVQSGDTRYNNTTNGWALLNVSPDAPVRFGFAVVNGLGGTLTQPSLLTTLTMPTVAAGVPWYTVQAACDHDGNGVFAVFASTSLSGEIASANEAE